MRRTPRLDPGKSVLFLADRTLITRTDNPQGSYVVIKSPAPADLSLLLEAIDGVRDLEAICARLSASFDAETVVEALEALDGIAIELSAPEVAPRTISDHRIAVVGASRLAADLARELQAVTGITLLWLGDEETSVTSGVASVQRVEPAALSAQLASFPVVIAVHSGIRLGEAIDINRAALAAGVICVHVVSETGSLVVGPATVPFRTPCLECGQIFWHFKVHAADGASQALRPLWIPELEDERVRAALMTLAVQQLEQELAGLLVGAPYPRLLGSFLRLSLADGIKPVELAPTTNCESCHGCNPRGIQLGVRSDAIPDLPRLERRPLISDTTGGVRSIELGEAKRRAEAAMSTLGVEMKARGYSKKVQRRYPELQSLPFVHVSPTLTFRRDADLVLGRAPQQCFGKGALPEQAMCSGMFEFFERTLLMYRGGVDIVRAPYADVREHALDMHAFTDGVLAIPDRGPRRDFDPALEIDWVWGRCLRRDRPTLIPAHTVLLAMFDRDDRPTLSTFRGSQIEMPLRGSSGCAAGATREDAVLQGLYEVIEHDARLVHDRTGLEAPAIDLASIDEPLTRRLIEQVQSAGCELHLRYLTRDLGIPVVEAYLTSTRDLTFHRVPGWGSHHDPAIAIRRAITETIQCIGASESVQSQTFLGGMYAITNSFHESRYCLDRTSGVIEFGDLPRPDPSWRSVMDYLEAAVSSVTTALPEAELCYFEYPAPGLDGIHVVAVVATHVVNNLSLGHIVQDRVRDARRGHEAGARLELSELYLGDLKL